MEITELRKLVDRLVALSKESETVEFKENFHSKEEIGERISALANSACLLNQPYSYLVFGIENDTHTIKGTTFRSKKQMVGNEELEVWLLNRLNPRIDFQCFDFEYSDNIYLVLYKIPAAENVPVKFLNVGYVSEYGSRNEKLADIMRRMGFCEEKGSGLDKTIFNVELYQLPPVRITVQENRTIVTLFAYKALNSMDKEERQSACYQHACLKYVSNEKMTNQTFRERLGIEEHNAALASRIIKDTLEAELIKEDNPDNHSRKFRKYVPWWA